MVEGWEWFGLSCFVPMHWLSGSVLKCFLMANTQPVIS